MITFKVIQFWINLWCSIIELNIPIKHYRVRDIFASTYKIHVFILILVISFMLHMLLTFLRSL